MQILARDFCISYHHNLKTFIKKIKVTMTPKKKEKKKDFAMQTRFVFRVVSLTTISHERIKMMDHNYC